MAQQFSSISTTRSPAVRALLRRRSRLQALAERSERLNDEPVGSEIGAKKRSLVEIAETTRKYVDAFVAITVLVGALGAALLHFATRKQFDCVAARVDSLEMTVKIERSRRNDIVLTRFMEIRKVQDSTEISQEMKGYEHSMQLHAARSEHKTYEQLFDAACTRVRLECGTDCQVTK